MFEILENISECVVIVNKHNQIEYANKAFEKVFGYTPDEVINESLDILIPKSQAKHHSKNTEKYFEKPSARSMGNGKNLNRLHKNGHEFPVEVSLSHINIENHTLAIAIVVDVTEQRKLMDEISLSKTLYS